MLFIAHVSLAQSEKDENRIIDGREYFTKQKSPTGETKTVDGKTVKIYIVEKGDTWYAIARKFNINYSELRLANKNTDDALKPGMSVNIPTSKLKPTDPFFEKNYTTPAKAAREDKYHIVEKSQTLYSISRLYGTSVDKLKELNSLTSNEISIGQKLLVEKGSVESATEEPAPVARPEVKPTVKEPAPEIQPEATPVEPIKSADADAQPRTEQEAAPVDTEPEVTADDESVVIETESVPAEEIENKDSLPAVEMMTGMENEEVTRPSTPEPESETNENTSEDAAETVVFADGRQQVVEDGQAVILEEDEQSPDKYYALHRSAPIGTIIRVLNMSNSRKIYVKVTGRLIDNSENKGTLIKISKASGDKLGATDKKFQVNLLYGLTRD